MSHDKSGYVRLIKSSLTYFLIAAAISISFSACSETNEYSPPNYFARLGDSLFSAADYDSAAVCFRKAAEEYKAEQNWDEYIFCLAKTGNSYRKTGDFTKAINVLSHADSLAGIYLPPDHPAKLRINNESGAAYHYLGDLDEARKYYDKTLHDVDSNLVYEDVRISDEVVQTYNLLGMLDFDEGQYQESMNDFQKGVDIRDRLPSDSFPSKAMFYGNFAIVYSVKGDFENAAKYYEKSLREKIRIFGENHPHVALDYQNMGVLFGEHLGDYKRAQVLYEKALQIMLQNYGEKHIDVARIYFNMGSNYYRSGDLKKSLVNYDKALNIFYEALGKEYHHDVSMSYHEMGKVYENLKDYKKAVDYYELALQIRLDVYKTTMHPDVAHSYNSLGNIKRLEGEYKESIHYFEDALKIFKHSYKGLHPDIAETYNLLAEVYSDKNNFNNALKNIQLALIANIPGYTNNNPKSIPPVDDAISDIRLLKSISLKSEIYYKKYSQRTHSVADLKESLKNYKALSRLIDHVRKGYKAEGSKFLLAGNSVEDFDNAINVCIKLYKATKDTRYINDAFVFSEQSKSRVLLDAMLEADARKLSGIPDSLLAREKQLRIDLAFYDTELQYQLYEAGRTDSIQVRRINEKLFTLQNEYLKLKDTFEKNYPKYHELKYKRSNVTIADARKALDDNEILLEYFTGTHSLYIFLVSNGNFELEQIPIDSSFSGLCQEYLSSIKKLDKPGYIETAEKLYNILISPVDNKLTDAKSLVIIPDGVLHYLPFEALIKNGNSENDFTSLNYLINRFEVTYNYSASLQSQISESAAASGVSSGFLGFAPVFDKTRDEEGFIMSAIHSIFGGGESTTRSGQYRDEFKALPYTKDEIESIVSLFKENSRKAKGFFYSSANEINLKQNISDYRYIHIASHSFVNPLQPQLSGIAFASQEDDQNIEDGILYSGEIYNLNLNADLVVLSSCESGIGKLVKGEGMMALTRGFLFSGARNVMTSLWKVLDRNTSKLMIRFYKNILAGEDYKTSLRNAKLEMIKGADTSFPLNWSGFILIEQP